MAPDQSALCCVGTTLTFAAAAFFGACVFGLAATFALVETLAFAGAFTGALAAAGSFFAARLVFAGFALVMMVLMGSSQKIWRIMEARRQDSRKSGDTTLPSTRPCPVRQQPAPKPTLLPAKTNEAQPLPRFVQGIIGHLQNFCPNLTPIVRGWFVTTYYMEIGRASCRERV